MLDAHSDTNQIPNFNIKVTTKSHLLHSTDASELLKSLGHFGRLSILCHLREGEKSVTELRNVLSLPQATVSQNLARLRVEGLISCRKDGRQRYYSINNTKARALVDFLNGQYC